MNINLLLRAVIAIFLMVVFYSLAIATSAGLLFSAYGVAEFAFTEASGRGIVNMVLLAGGMGFGGLVVLWSIIPRIDRFTPPGPALSQHEQPLLFEEIQRVAAGTGQQPPADVYLVPDVNAFVTERGGWMGIGSRRVMGLGLGLLNILSVSELRAVIAHEFGHFHGGDTKLGPWIYKTRKAMIRTVENLRKAGDGAARTDLALVSYVLAAVRKPFEWFARGYLRITHAISRAQEYSADKVAATTQGPKALTDGLKKTHRAALAFDAFLRNELGPLLGERYHAPLGEGFRRFLAAEAIATELADLERKELEEGSVDPYDTHPPLRERIRHAEALGPQRVDDDTRPAIELVANVPALESLLFAEWTDGAELRQIRWEDAAAVYAKSWQSSREGLARALEDETLVALPGRIANVRKIASRVLSEDVSKVPDRAVTDWAIGQFGSALSACLLEHGYEASSAPGEPFRFRRGTVEVEPFGLVRRYLNAEISEEQWRGALEAAGMEEVPLASGGREPRLAAS